MIIRATRKVLNLNRIKPIKNDSELNGQLPGEWYVDLISLGKTGKFALHFLHHPTKIVVIVRGRSIKKTYSKFKIHVSEFLKRNGYKKLIQGFDLESELFIYSTNDRSMLAVMRDIKWNSEYQCLRYVNIESIDFEWIEDISMSNLFTTKKTGSEYLRTRDIMDGFLLK